MGVSVTKYLKLACAAVMVGATAAGAWWAMEEMVVARTVNEGRTVADMAENVGRWASQYGGVHVRTEGANATLPGTFLTRSVYAKSDAEASLLQGARLGEERTQKREALQHLEAYHWKNPALVQRELADVMLATGTRAQYRLTARTVLNPNNEANAFELEALSALQEQASKEGGSKEFWKVQDGRLLYARAVVAQKSCLKCHESAAKAPEFLRANKRFNGGGGFNYVVGKPAGVISVSVPVPDTSALLSNGLPTKAWAAVGIAFAAGAGLLGLSLRKPPRKVVVAKRAGSGQGSGGASAKASAGTGAKSPEFKPMPVVAAKKPAKAAPDKAQVETIG